MNCKPEKVYEKIFEILLKGLDENQATDNRIISPYMTGTLKHLMHMTSKYLFSTGIQNIQCFVFYIYKTTFSFQLHDSKKNIKSEQGFLDGVYNEV